MPRALAAALGRGLFLGGTLAVAHRWPAAVPLIVGAVLIACGIAALLGDTRQHAKEAQ